MKMDLKCHKVWIPAFAGMTLRVRFFASLRMTLGLTAVFTLFWAGFESSAVAAQGTIKITASQSYILYVNGSPVGSDDDPDSVEVYNRDLNTGDTIAVEAMKGAGTGGIICEIWSGNEFLATNLLWQVSSQDASGWQNNDFDHTLWPGATELTTAPNISQAAKAQFDPRTKWIWARSQTSSSRQFFWTRFDPAENGLVKITADRSFELYRNGTQIAEGDSWRNVRFIKTHLEPEDLIAIHARGASSSQAGCIAQIHWLVNSEVHHILVTDKSWKVSRFLEADWEKKEFNDLGWGFAKKIGRRSVLPWKSSGTLAEIYKSAYWIWNDKLNRAREIWLRRAIPNASLVIAADDRCTAYHNGVKLGKGSKVAGIFGLNVNPGDVIAVKAVNIEAAAGFLSSIGYGASEILSNASWKYSTGPFTGSTWTLPAPAFDDSSWLRAISLGRHGISPWGFRRPVHLKSEWIWAADTASNQSVYFRFIVGSDNDSTGFTTLQFTANKTVKFFVNGQQQKLSHGNQWKLPDKLALKLFPGDVVAFEADNWGSRAGFILDAKGTRSFTSDTTWKVSTAPVDEEWKSQNFPDESWDDATSYGAHKSHPFRKKVQKFDNREALWIWSDRNEAGTENIDRKVFLRKIVTGLASQVINTGDGSINPARLLSFNTNAGESAERVASPQAVAIDFKGTPDGTQAIYIHTENPDGRPGMIGVQDPNYNVPILWAVYDDPLPQADHCDIILGEDQGESAGSVVVDVNDPALPDEGSIAVDIQGEYAIIGEVQTNEGTVPIETTDGNVWVYFCADYTGVPAQTYRTENLVIELITLP